MDTSRWEQALIHWFPNLTTENFETVAPPSDDYNCIAYAANDTGKRWDYHLGRYWPPWATRSSSMQSLKEVFAGLQYEECNDGNHEAGYQKLALYEAGGAAQHAAVQMPNGRWRSKMGPGPVIEHDSPESLSGGMYGEPTVFMRRAVEPNRERQHPPPVV